MDLCSPGSELQRWKRIYPGKKIAEKTGLRGFLFKNEKYDLCLDGEEISMNKGLLVRRCDFQSVHQRFMIQYNAPLR
jgi:hypothetical protein